MPHATARAPVIERATPLCAAAADITLLIRHARMPPPRRLRRCQLGYIHTYCLLTCPVYDMILERAEIKEDI